MFEKFRCMFAFLDQVIARECTQCLASLVSFPHIHLHHTAINLADFCDGFAGIEVDDIEGVEGLVRFSPSQGLDCQHVEIRMEWRSCFGNKRKAGVADSLVYFER